MITPLGQNDRRALTLLVFHALRKAVEMFPTDSFPTDRELEDLLIDVICLLPGLGALTTEKTGRLRLFCFPIGRNDSGTIHQDTIKAQELLFDIQPLIDSIRIVWKDYVLLMERDSTEKII